MATATTGITKQVTSHSLDKLGLKFGLYRFDSETLVHFRNRILDTFIHKANSTTVGMINGASREFGAIPTQLGVIKPVLALGVPLVNAPGIRITNTYIEFYSDFTLGTLEERLDIYTSLPRVEGPASAYYLTEIYNWVVASPNWEWYEDLTDIWKLSKYLIPSQSFEVGKPRRVRSGMTKLRDSVVPGTLRSDSRLVDKLVASIAAIVDYGDYYLDPIENYLYTYEPAIPEVVTVFYDTYNDRIYLDWAPVEFQELSDFRFVDSLYEKDEADDNLSYENVDIGKRFAKLILEAYRKDGTFWFAEDINDTPVDIRNEYELGDVISDDHELTLLNVQKNLRELLREV